MEIIKIIIIIFNYAVRRDFLSLVMSIERVILKVSLVSFQKLGGF
jgi:hypothetical protein